MANSSSSRRTANHTFAPRTTGTFRPPEALLADHDKILAQWRHASSSSSSPSPHEALVQLVDAHARSLRVTRAVCLGIGTFDPDPDGGGGGGSGAKRAAHVQLCALLTLTSRLECIFQEPILTESDTLFLRRLGHRVVDSPAAYALIDEETLLFGVHLYRPVYAAALPQQSSSSSSLPAIFVGTGWDVWDTVTMEKQSDLRNIRLMHETYSCHPFPQDVASTAFSSTSIYFRPAGRQQQEHLPTGSETAADGVPTSADDAADALRKDAKDSPHAPPAEQDDSQQTTTQDKHTQTCKTNMQETRQSEKSTTEYNV